jgi:hypothetical protein
MLIGQPISITEQHVHCYPNEAGGAPASADSLLPGRSQFAKKDFQGR